MNKATLFGRLGRDPELKYTASGKAVCKFGLATSRKFVKDGNKQEITQWHNIVVWGKLAELCNQYLSKGKLVVIEGEITYRKYTAKDGVEKYMTEIVASSVEFVSTSPSNDNTNNTQNSTAQNSTSDFTSDDIPF